MEKNDMDKSVLELVGKISDHWGKLVAEKYKAGDYEVVQGTAPEPYDENDSSVCWGWLEVGNSGIFAAVFANGERGNEDYDREHDHKLTIYKA